MEFNTNANPTLNIVVCYRIPGFTLLQSIWDSIVQSLDNTQAGILVGDFNSHNIIWNCTHSDTNSKQDKNVYVQRSLIIKSKRTNRDLFASELKLNSYTFSTTEYKSLSGSNEYELFAEVVTSCLKKVPQQNNFLIDTCT